MAKREAGHDARLDTLTGLPGARAWSEAVEAERVRRARYRRPVAFIIVEMGGLPTGSRHETTRGELIMGVAGLLRRNIRDVDLVARIADDRFGVMLPETSPVALDAVVSRIRAAADEWRARAPELELTLSIGRAATGPFDDVREALRSADDNLHLVRRGA